MPACRLLHGEFHAGHVASRDTDDLQRAAEMNCLRTSRPSPASSTLAVGWCSTADARWCRTACSSPSLSSHQPLILQERWPSELSGLACATVMRRCANATLGQAATAAAQRTADPHVRPRHEADAVQRSITATVLWTQRGGSLSVISSWSRSRSRRGPSIAQSRHNYGAHHHCDPCTCIANTGLHSWNARHVYGQVK